MQLTFSPSEDSRAVGHSSGCPFSCVTQARDKPNVGVLWRPTGRDGATPRHWFEIESSPVTPWTCCSHGSLLDIFSIDKTPLTRSPIEVLYWNGPFHNADLWYKKLRSPPATVVIGSQTAAVTGAVHVLCYKNATMVCLPPVCPKTTTSKFSFLTSVPSKFVAWWYRWIMDMVGRMHFKLLPTLIGMLERIWSGLSREFLVHFNRRRKSSLL